MSKYTGCFTALITPFKDNGEVDYEGLKKLVDFQSINSDGIVLCGTTGESPVLTWKEHLKIIKIAARLNNGRGKIIAGIGSNNFREVFEAAEELAEDAKPDAFLLVDPYYNCPSSLEIRLEYLEPLTNAFPEIDIIPYIIPGRTGTQLLPEDLAILAKKYPNVCAVKEATGDIRNAERIRELCGPDFSILSGDDNATLNMMLNPQIKANGVVSVMSNIIPFQIRHMVYLVRGEKGEDDARILNEKLSSLFNVVTIKTKEESIFGQVECRFRNPVPVKTLMNFLGMPAGPCRPPLGKLTKNGFDILIASAKIALENISEIFEDVESFFSVFDIKERLELTVNWWDNLYYPQSYPKA